MADQPTSPPSDGLEEVLLGEAPHLNRVEVSEQAGVPLEIAQELWRLLGFARTTDDEVAFTEADVTALRQSHELVRLGILSPERQSALVRTWGRSFARLAEWQSDLVVDVAGEDGADPLEALTGLAAEVLPRVEALQAYAWRRHLVSAGSRLLAVTDAGESTTTVGFVDIVGYTSRSKALDEPDLVAWLERFESTSQDLVTEAGGRIIKNIGDEVLFVADDLPAAADVALRMTEQGADHDDEFPEVRAGLAHGPVVSRLGDVFGGTVNLAARLTSAARPGTVLVDEGAHDALGADDGSPFALRRVHRLSAKGYSKLPAWALRRA